jgi:hypothetical protein
VDISPLAPPGLADLAARRARREVGVRRERPFRFLLDSRIFRLLCAPEGTALDNFRASLARLGLAPEGGLPDLELTPLAIFDLIGVDSPQFPAVPLPKSMMALKAVDVGVLLVEAIKKEFKTVPDLEAASLERRLGELRQAAPPAARDLFDLCLSASPETLRNKILDHLTFDTLVRFRFPEEYRDRMTHLFNSFLLDSHLPVAGLTKARVIRMLWDQSLERILKRNPMERSEILAVDQEIKPRTFKDYLGWETIHYAVFGYLRQQVHPVIAFAPEPEDRFRARCKAYKTTLRVFLEDISPEELRTVLRPLIRAWRPGWLVPCRPDGTLEAALSTGEVPIWAGSSPPALEPLESGPED